MPSYQEWVRKIDINIDYYSAFIKSWIAFNSWYRSEYTERTDRGIIEKLKTENNRFKGYIETMLDENNNSDEAIIFKKNLKDLQAALVNAAIVTQERDGINQQISFSEIAINNPKRVAEGDYRVTHYKVQRTNEKISTLVHKKNDPTTIYFQFEQKKYDETELDVHADFLRLGIEQQGQCKAFYKEICPYVIESVLTRDKDNKVEFIAERSQVSRGIIEVLYLLRCSLMHGEVFPDNNAMEVYKYAYSILAAILKKMFCIFRKNCASVPEERSAIPLQTEQSSAGLLVTVVYSTIPARKFKTICLGCHSA